MYSRYEWVEYSVKEDAVYCFSCRHFAKSAVRKGEILGSRTFIDRGFCKWSDQHALLEQHQESERHQSSMLAWANFRDVAAGKRTSTASQLSAGRSTEVKENREHVKALLRATRYLGCQGLAFRGQIQKIVVIFVPFLKKRLRLMTTLKLKSNDGMVTTCHLSIRMT